MARKKKVVKKIVKENSEEKVSKNVKERESRQLYWFVGIVIFVFVLFVGVYLYVQGLNKFSYVGVSWMIEDNNGLMIYHARFPAFYNHNVTYNLFLRTDPRTDDVFSSGNFSNFRYGGVLAFSPEVDECRGEVPVETVTLASFLKSGVGLTELVSGTTSGDVFEETGRVYADCSISNRGVYIIEMGEESSVVQNEKNPFCYTITIQNCTDIAPIEKFMVETVRNHYGD